MPVAIDTERRRFRVLEDLRRGVVRADDGSIIAQPRMSREQFEHSEIGRLSKLTYEYALHATFVTPDLRIAGTLCVATVAFQGGMIRMAILTILSPQTSSTDPYAEKTKHDLWLESLFGRVGPYDFRWGSIQTMLDTRDGTAPITLVYNSIYNRLKRAFRTQPACDESSRPFARFQGRAIMLILLLLNAALFAAMLWLIFRAG